VTASVYWSPVSTLVTPNMWNLLGATAPVNVPPGNTLVVAPGLTWPAAAIPAPGHYCFVARLDHSQDPAPPLPGPTDWAGFLDMVRNHNNVTWRNFNVVDGTPDPRADPIELPFLLGGAPVQARAFDIEIAVDLPEDAGLHLLLPPGAAGALPRQWRELLEPTDKDRFLLKVPRLRNTAFCGVRLHADAAHECKFVLQPSKGMARGSHRVAIRQYHGDLQVGGINWLLRPERH
jgi:hypothetical protein